MRGGANQWQNVQFVERQLIMVIMSAILIEDQIECGNQTLDVLAVKLMEHLENYMYVLPV